MEPSASENNRTRIKLLLGLVTLLILAVVVILGIFLLAGRSKDDLSNEKGALVDLVTNVDLYEETVLLSFLLPVDKKLTVVEDNFEKLLPSLDQSLCRKSDIHRACCKLIQDIHRERIIKTPHAKSNSFQFFELLAKSGVRADFQSTAGFDATIIDDSGVPATVQVTKMEKENPRVYFRQPVRDEDKLIEIPSDINNFLQTGSEESVQQFNKVLQKKLKDEKDRWNELVEIQRGFSPCQMGLFPNELITWKELQSALGALQDKLLDKQLTYSNDSIQEYAMMQRTKCYFTKEYVRIVTGIPVIRKNITWTVYRVTSIPFFYQGKHCVFHDQRQMVIGKGYLEGQQAYELVFLEKKYDRPFCGDYDGRLCLMETNSYSVNHKCVSAVLDSTSISYLTDKCNFHCL